MVDDAANRNSGGLRGYDDAYKGTDVPRGSWAGYVFLNPLTGQPLVGNGNYVVGAITTNYAAGVPVSTAAQQAYVVAIGITGLQEKLWVAPFIPSPSAPQDQTALMGVSNISAIFNLQAPSAARIFRVRPAAVAMTNLDFCSAGAGPWFGPKMSFTYLTPNLSVPLPSKNVCPYTQVARYISSNFGAIAAGATTQLQSQSLVLSSIPSLIIVKVQPSAYENTEAQWMMPITGCSVSFDNFSGMLSSAPATALFDMAVRNGLSDVPYQQWLGRMLDINGAPVATTGGFIILSPGVDFMLPVGAAGGLGGSWNFSIQVTATNTAAINKTPVMTVIVLNSGFMETAAGVTRTVISPVASEATVLSATAEGAGPDLDVAQHIQGGGFLSSAFGHVRKLAGYAQQAHQFAKQHAPAVKAALRATGNEHAAKAASAMESIGLGRPTSLACRLM